MDVTEVVVDAPALHNFGRSAAALGITGVAVFTRGAGNTVDGLALDDHSVGAKT